MMLKLPSKAIWVS